MLNMAKRTKKPFPFHDGTPNENAPIRVIRMWKPECPVDPTPELRQKDGTFKPNPRYTGEENCMQKYRINNQGVWDIEKCESLGHDPWHTVFYKRFVKDVIDPETGEITDQKTQIVKETRPNIVAVTLNIRHTSGTEVLLAKARGYLTLDEYGAKHPEEDFADPCEFRACTSPVRLVTRFGNFCSERHARLVAADAKQIMRFIKNERDLDEGFQNKVFDQYQDQLDSINLGIKNG